MNRTIFLRELRIGLLQELVSVGTLLSLFAAGGWLAATVYGQPVREMAEDLLLFMIALAALLAFSSGARTFTAESRRRQELFFFTLPVSRRALWLSLIGGRLVPALPVPALLVLVNDLLPEGLPGLRHLGSGGMAVFLALFASGACLSLFCRRDTVAYLAGTLITFPVVAQTLAFTISDFSSGSLREGLLTFSVGLLAAAFLGLSWFFFQRGEGQARTRQLANATFLGVTLASVLLLIGAGTQPALLEEFAGPWTQDPVPRDPLLSWEVETARLVSPGGRYLAVAEALSRQQRIWKITVVETATGRRVGERHWRDLRWVSWDAREEVLRILCRDHALPLFWSIGEEPVTAWIGLTPDGRELTRDRFWEFHTAASFRKGPDLLVDQRGYMSRLILLKEPRNTPVLAEISQSKEWILPLPWGAMVWGETIWRMEDGRVRGLKSDAVGALTSQMTSRRRDLAQRAGGHEPLPDGLRGAAAVLQAIKDLLPFAYSAEADVGLYLPVRGLDGRATLNDGALDHEISLPGCERGPSAVPELKAAPSSDHLLVRFKCRTATTSAQTTGSYRHFSYVPGSGSVKPLPGLDPVLDDRAIRLAYLDEQTAIWRPEKGETWKILRDGQVRTLWPPRSGE